MTLFFRSVFLVSPALCLLAQTQAPVPARPAAPAPAASQAPKPQAAKPHAPKPQPPKPQPAQPQAAPAPAPQPGAAGAPISSATSLPALPKLPPDRVVITVGDEKITAGEFEHVVAAFPEQNRAALNTAAGRKQFVETFIRVKLLAQEGRRRKIDQDPGYQAQIALQRDELLASRTYNTLAKDIPLTNEQLQQYYQQHRNEFESVRASHILVRFKGSQVPVKPGQKDLTEEEALAKAQALRKEIEAGGDFAAVAKRDSDDAGSGVQGGDLGTFARGRMYPSFEEAAFGLPVGQLSEPVKTMFGYHLIRVQQRDAKTLEQVKPEIEKKLRPQAVMQTVDDIKKNTNVVVDSQFLGEETK